MTDVRSDVDLAALARPQSSVAPPRRRWIRYLVPIAILLAFAALVLSSLTDWLAGSVEVTVVRPTAAVGAANASAASGAVVVQAAGWAEPDPFPIFVTALAAGVVREMRVLESQEVKAGDPVAELNNEEAALRCAAAQATLAKANAEVERARAELRFAETSFEAALAVTEALAVAESEKAGRDAALVLRTEAANRAKAQVTIAEVELDLQNALAKVGGAGPRQVELAEAKLAEARANVASMQAEVVLARAEADGARAKLDRARRERELRLDDRRALDTSRAALAAAEATVREVQTMCDETALRLSRMTVRAPSDGVVLERLAVPGTPLEAGTAGSAVATLFDPAHVRIRVDVPQAQVAKLAVGMRAEVLSEGRAGRPYRGEVVRFVSKADIQKVTIQVHVRVLDGDRALRPETLCQVRFYATAGGAASSPAGFASAVEIPARLLLEDQTVWVVDGARGVASRRRVEIGARRGDLVEVVSGLNATDKLIDEGRAALHEGARVRVREGAHAAH